MSDEWIHAERFAGTEIDNTEEFYDALRAKRTAYPSFSPEAERERAARARERGTHATQLRVSRRWPDTPRGWVAETARRRKALNEEGKALDHLVPFMHAKIAGLECESNLQVLPTPRANKRKNNVEPISDEDAVIHVREGRA